MYSTTISHGVRSDGQLHPQRPAPSPAPPKAPAPAGTPPSKPAPFFASLSAEQLLIALIAFLLLQNEKKDPLLILALAYILL